MSLFLYYSKDEHNHRGYCIGLTDDGREVKYTQAFTSQEEAEKYIKPEHRFVGAGRYLKHPEYPMRWEAEVFQERSRLERHPSRGYIYGANG